MNKPPCDTCIFAQEDEFSIDEELRFLKEFFITVPTDYDHANQLTVFTKKYRKQFEDFDKAVTDENFANVSDKLTPGEKYKFKIWGIRYSIHSQMCLEFLKDNNALLVGAQGLSLVYQEKREELPPQKWTASFDEKSRLWEYNSDFYIPTIFRSSRNTPFNNSCYDDHFDLAGFQLNRNYSFCLMGVFRC